MPSDGSSSGSGPGAGVDNQDPPAASRSIFGGGFRRRANIGTQPAVERLADANARLLSAVRNGPGSRADLGTGSRPATNPSPGSAPGASAVTQVSVSAGPAPSARPTPSTEPTPSTSGQASTAVATGTSTNSQPGSAPAAPVAATSSQSRAGPTAPGAGSSSSSSSSAPDTRPVMRYWWGLVVGPDPRTWQEIMEEGWGDMRSFVEDHDLEWDRDGITRALEILRGYVRAEARELARLADRQRRGLPYSEDGYPRYRNWERHEARMSEEERERIDEWIDAKRHDARHRGSTEYKHMMERRLRERRAARQAEMAAAGEVSAVVQPPRPRRARTASELEALRAAVGARHRVAASELGTTAGASGNDEDVRNYHYVRNGYSDGTTAGATGAAAGSEQRP